MSWYAHVDGGQIGPLTLEQVHAMLAEGRVGVDTPIYHESLGDWRPLASVPQLAPGSVSTEDPQWVAPPPFQPTAPTSSSANGMHFLVPVQTSGWAIAAGYLGLLSVLIVFAPFALITGIIALRDLHRRPHLHGKGRAWFGIIAGLAMCMVSLAFLMVAQI